MPEPHDLVLPRGARRALVVTTMLVTAGLVLGSVTMLVPALSEIGVRLGARQSELQWIVDITAIILAALLLGSGALLDRFGRRRGLVLGLALLTAALVHG
ncbi:MAG: hypothetical protein M0P31_07415 [Solirubrobacteraceae bacterium]|nr:hypothetical protein [Solirubrobacteraceae bacterium]